MNKMIYGKKLATASLKMMTKYGIIIVSVGLMFKDIVCYPFPQTDVPHELSYKWSYKPL